MSASAYDVGVVRARTVVFTRAETGGISVGVDAVDDDGTVIASLDAGGLLTYRPDRVSEIALASGSTVNGIRAVYASGDPYDSAEYPPRDKPLLMLRAVDGGYAVLVHESGAITEPTERITNAYGATAVTIGPDSVQVFWSTNGVSRRWRVPHWGYYQAGTPGDWAGSPPGTNWAALDRLAAQVAALGGVPVP